VWSSVDAVGMPLGAIFAWKLVVSGEGRVRWEEGDDRVDEVALPALLTHDVSRHVASWR
jgi:hypothetical protein